MPHPVDTTDDQRPTETATWEAFLESIILRACILEASAQKPGNVHPHASFSDTTYEDFVRSAEIIAPILARTRNVGVGKTILDAVQMTQETLKRNTNLGIVLLLAPLCAVPSDQTLQTGIEQILLQLSREDATWAYRAIRLANPGGLGSAAEGDVSSQPTGTLLDMMRLAADRDLIAREYAEGFPLTLSMSEDDWRTPPSFIDDWNAAIVQLQLRLMSAHSDSLILRKCGLETARESSLMADRVLQCGGVLTEAGQAALEDFDRWLRADGHRRNPGTTADLIAAILFASARERMLELPSLATIEQDIQQRRFPHA